MSTLDEIYKKIKKAKNIVILTHENPDGDAIGSSLAMYLSLKQLGKDAEVVIPKYSKCFQNLPGIENVLESGTRDSYDLAISVDAATIKLLNGWANYFENADTSIVIDHHSTNSMFGDINYVDYSSPACAQVLYVIFRHFRWKITPDIGDDLLAGIITDTGGFQYSGVSRDTFEIASSLMAVGAHLTKIYKDVMDTKTRASFELKKIALSRMEFLEDNKITFTYITNEDEKKVHAGTGDYEGIVNEGRSIEGVEVSIFLHEREDGGFKLSLRSNGKVNVSDVCLVFGGGGHPFAAGATILNMTPEEIRDKVAQEVKRQL